jgi:hypothetical protein
MTHELPRRIPGATTLGPAPTPLVPLYVHPAEAARDENLKRAWDPDALAGATVIVNVADGPGSTVDEAYVEATALLAAAGVPMLGYVDLGYAARPLGDIVEDIERWSAYPMAGVFLDQAPTTPFSIGPVALAIRVARRARLFVAVLNPGTPADPVYRELGVPICAFEGSWADYQAWSGLGAQPGDGHLVHGVPAAQLATARKVMGWRGAGFGLVTDRELPNPWQGLPTDAARTLVAVG